MPSLFDPFTLSGLSLPNRLVMAPMTRSRATDDGLATESVAAYYAQRATAGLIISEGIQPSLRSQSTLNTPGLHTSGQVAAWRKVTDAVHTNGGRIFAQLMHSGRVSHPDVTGTVPVAPSAVAVGSPIFTAGFGDPTAMQPAPTPRELTTAEVAEEIGVYVEAARNAIDAGFDGVELHGANGYLIHQFLSSNANQRTDVYGGSIAGRIRFAVEAAEATAQAVGADKVGIRLSPGSQLWGIEEHDVADLYAALVGGLAPLDLAYLHTVATAEEDVLLNMRKLWPSALIVNPSTVVNPQPSGKAEGEHWLAQGADLISYGRNYLANPDLVERLRTGAPLTEAEAETMYSGGDQGYITYSNHQY
ncbi:alkene reductase [Streptomyces griseorubiginosus]|uniref:alkene reductase n=1 Tax=Streptomyces griseorubiginosus TaxID=67304 RepID=UPI001AD634D6|nr:alkene reductase [Streptomyces griseorubiginosus]MBO4253163.1 alkene reductase [Streptomyces griseorubiginosus]